MFSKLRKNKKGIVMSWIYILLFLFALGILYTTFLYVFEGHLIPTIEGITDSTITDPTDNASIHSGINKYMTYFKMMPFILIFVVIVYGFANAIYKQSGGNAFQ